MRTYYCLALLISLFVSSTKLEASHIVGGEFELIHIDGFNYRLNLVLYFDAVNGNPGILNGPNAELTVFPTIFRKSDDQPVLNYQFIQLNRMVPTSVSYTNPECALPGELETKRLIFTRNIELPPNIFNDREGYYVVWQRCCRNYTIDNIFSQDPNSGGVFAGQTFYLEFPPVVDADGQPFVNSSPVLFPPLSDYACVDRLYFADFSGDDPDGDSVVYSKVDPLNTSSGQAVPTPSPKPHGIVTYRPTFSLANIIPGAPSFGIDETGLLTVRPAKAGLFVFAVKAEEYRNGIKIGEVRRDFQMLVLDCLDPGVKPELKVEAPDGSISDTELSVEFGIDDDRCVTFTITDQDEGDTTLVISWVAVNFDRNINTVASVNYETLANDEIEVEICFEECPPQQDVPFTIDFIASDDACPLPLKDTLRLNVLVEAPDNQAPEIVLDTNFDDGIADLLVGELIDLGIIGTDPDGDTVIVDLLNAEELRQLYGITFLSQRGTGDVKAQFGWETSCSNLGEDFAPIVLDLSFVVTDEAKCFATSDTVSVRVRLNDHVAEIEEFIPANVFTPNRDQWNNTFRMPTLPNDTCEGEFEGISIFNRWGRLVFASDNRDFSWDGDGAATGIYFYNLIYADVEYKGTISLLR